MSQVMHPPMVHRFRVLSRDDDWAPIAASRTAPRYHPTSCLHSRLLATMQGLEVFVHLLAGGLSWTRPGTKEERNTTVVVRRNVLRGLLHPKDVQ